jgi:hypothetical protein
MLTLLANNIRNIEDNKNVRVSLKINAGKKILFHNENMGKIKILGKSASFTVWLVQQYLEHYFTTRLVQYKCVIWRTGFGRKHLMIYVSMAL